MDLGRHFSVRRRQHSRDLHDHDDENVKGYLPLLASPINEDAREALSNRQSDIEKTTIAASGAESSATTMLAGNGRTSSGNIVIYKPHHEASSIELFYDLFFVANLGKLEDSMIVRSTDRPQPTLQPCTSIQTPNVRLLPGQALTLLTTCSARQLPEAFHALVVYLAEYHIIRC